MRKERAVLSYVSIAEIYVLSRRFGWGAEKRDQIDNWRREMVVVPIERDPILDSYVELDVFSLSNGQMMGKNDVWIAATADAMDGKLVTTDNDFDHLHEQYLSLVRFDPETAERVTIA